MEQELLQSVQTAYATGQLDRAAALCDEGLSRTPDNAALHNMAAIIAAQSNDLANALPHADRALELAPDDTAVMLNAALIYERAGALDKASAASSRLLASHPEHPGALASLANIARLQHQYDQALALYERATTSAPTQIALLANYASLLSLTGKFGEARDVMARALAIEPQSADLLAAWGDILGAAGDLPKAIEQYAQALDRANAHNKPSVLANMSVAQLKAGDVDGAKASAAQLDHADPGNRTAAAVRYIAAVKSNDAAAAGIEMDTAQYLYRVTNATPTAQDLDTFSQALRAEVLAHRSLEFEPASKTTRGGAQTANLVPNAGPAISALHNMLVEHVHTYLDERHGVAVAAARTMQHFELNIWATVLDEGGRQLPHIHPAGVLSGVYYVAVPDPEAGAIEFGEPPSDYAPYSDVPHHKIAPKTGDLLIFPSQFYHRTLAFAHADQRISIAFDVVPCSIDTGIPRPAIAQLLEVRRALGKRQLTQAAKLLSPLNEHLPQYGDAWFVRGQLAIHTGDHAAAVSHLTRATQLRPRMTAWWYQLGVTHQRLMDYPAAHAALDRCLRIDPAFEPARMTLASLHTDLGQTQQAVDVYREITRQRPSSGRAWYGLSLQEASSISDDDVATMARALITDDLAAADKSGLHFALGRALERRAEIDRSFQHYAAGNRIKHAAQPFDAEAEARNAQAICASFTPQVFEHFENSGLDDATPVLIVGMPRSGSTLIEQIITSHPDAIGAGESNALWRTFGGLGRYLPAGADLPRDIAQVSSDAWAALGQRYLSALRDDAGGDATRITDKLPFNYTLLGMLRLMLPNAYIIDARRNPLATCWSCFATSFGVDRGFTNDLGDLGATYRSYVSLMDHWETVLTKPIYLQQYEHMVADTEQQARALIAYLDLPWDAHCLEFHRNQRAVTTSSYAQVRQPIYTSSIDRWRPFSPHLNSLREALGPALVTPDDHT